MITKIIPWLGLCLLHGQNIPLFYRAITTTTALNLPIATPIIVIIGLACYLHHSLKIGRQALIYTIGNTIGILSNIVLILCILK